LPAGAVHLVGASDEGEKAWTAAAEPTPRASSTTPITIGRPIRNPDGPCRATHPPPPPCPPPPLPRSRPCSGAARGDADSERDARSGACQSAMDRLRARGRSATEREFL